MHARLASDRDFAAASEPEILLSLSYAALISSKRSFDDVVEEALILRNISAIATNFGSASIELAIKRISE